MSLRWRWALTLAGVSALAIGVTVVIALLVTQDQLRDQVDESLAARIEIAQRGPLELAGLSRPLPLRPPASRPIVDLDAIVQVIDVSGRPVFSFEGDPALPVSDADLALAGGSGDPILRDIEVDGIHHRMITAPLATSRRPSGSRLTGAVQIAIDISEIDQAIASLEGRLTLIGILAVCGAGIIGYLAARRAVAPIERLTEAAAEVAKTENLHRSLDVTAPGEVGLLASSFATMLESLRNSRSQQKRLVADASHEFRTPLTALRTTLETLRRRWDDVNDQQRSELLEAALDEVGELSVIATELVDLATDATRSAEAEVKTDLAELAERVADRYRTRTGREIPVRAIDAASVTVRSAQIERAIGNLIDNAVKWSSAPDPIEVIVDGSSLLVRDHGPGIPPDDLAHVFERFFRSDDARGMPGSGLGLAIVEHVIASHGGTVSARNHHEGGAEVGFTLPASSESQE